MKSFSTTSLVEDIQNEDRIKELENLLEKQKTIIEKQFQRIMELEEASGHSTESNSAILSDSVVVNEEKEVEESTPIDSKIFEAIPEEKDPDDS